MRVLLLGAGGHAQVIADVLLRMRDVNGSPELAGFLDDDPALKGRNVLGVPVLGAIDDLPLFPHDAVIVAIGDNKLRRMIFERLRERGERFAVAKHPRAIVAPDVVIGAGAMICGGVVVNTGAVIGASSILNTGCTVDHHNHVGDHVHIAPGVHTGGEVDIGEGTLIGIGATVMPRTRIGSWSIVGAAALVHEDIPDGVLVTGVPARFVRKL